MARLADSERTIRDLQAELERVRAEHTKLTVQFGEFYGGAGDIIDQRDKAEARLDRAVEALRAVTVLGCRGDVRCVCLRCRALAEIEEGG